MDPHLGDTQMILRECESYGCTRPQTAYILATAYHETAHTMKPVKEAYWLSEAWRKANLRYYPWYGRGYVQLTWQENYHRAGRKLDRDLTTDPDAVMEPKISAEILVRGMMEGWFTGKKVTDYISGRKRDYRQARRVVNDMDRADHITSLALDYEVALGGKAETIGKTPNGLPIYAHAQDFPDWRWPNFKPEEMDCKGTGRLALDPDAMDRLQALREDIGKPFFVVSAYRSPEHNRTVGGVRRSRHMEGIAFDISMSNHSQEDFVRAAERHGFNGIGRYRTFTHIDTRPNRARW